MTASARFRAAYAAHRAAEGRGSGGNEELLALPYPLSGSWRRQWGVRARTYERFLTTIVTPRARAVAPRPLDILDLGAGNGWLCYRMAREGHRAIALDWRRDPVDGLGAASGYAAHLPVLFPRIAASFQAIPLSGRRFDIVLFNAALHYAVGLEATLAAAAAVTATGGSIAILDSPFYRREQDGEDMVKEKHADMARTLGQDAGDLLSLQAIEFLTPRRLAQASAPLGLSWRRHRVRYPLWYELRGVTARLRGRRAPSRFDLWEAVVS